MLKLDPASKTLIPIAKTTLTGANILERAHLQEAITKSWDTFCTDLGYEELFLVGSEIVPHESCDDRIDILAIRRDGAPVIFELKRNRNRLQLLQAISYAAMVAQWNKDRFRHELGARDDDDAQELRSLLSDGAFALAGPEIVLVAESFDPEVILAADWLGGFKVPISAYAISAVEHRGDTLIVLDQRFPLPGLEDVYVRRSNRVAATDGDTSWDEAIKDVRFPFAKRAVDIFRRQIEGSPQRRGFHSIYSNSPLKRMKIYFKRDYLKVYTVHQSAEAEKVLRERLGSIIPYKTWGNEGTKNSGFTFQIETEAQFEQFLQAVGENGAAPRV